MADNRAHAYGPIGGQDPRGPGGPSGPGAQPPQASHLPPQVKGPFQILHFAASAAISFLTFYGALYCIFGDFQPLDMLNLLYLSFFGLLMCAVDTPWGGNFQAVVNFRRLIAKYLAVVTRLTGKGGTFLMLGTMSFTALWVNEAAYVLNVLVSIFVVVVGGFTIYQGLMKSHALEKARRALTKNSPGDPVQPSMDFFKRYAKVPGTGMTENEFNEGCGSSAGVQFSGAELRCIFNALSSSPDLQKLSQEDVTSWFQCAFILL